MRDLPELTTLPCPDDPVHHPFFAPHEENGRYVIPWPGYEKGGFMDLLRWRAGDNPHANEKQSNPPTIAREPDPLARREEVTGALTLTWLGHASFLIELDGVRVVIDPLFWNASPMVKRFVPSPLSPEQLTDIDLVLLTHGHRDHFDVKSLAAVSRVNPDALFVTPLGLNRALPKRCARRMEIDWWQQFEVGGVTFTHTPSQHWHQRTALDRNKALWGGWHMEGSHALYHTGDSGYFEGFSTARHVLGAPDVALLPAGAYEPRWFMSPQHMDPASALQTWKDLGATWGVPMHWGTFDLSNEPLDAGPAEFRARILEEEDGEERLARFLELPHGGSLGWQDKELRR